MLSKILFRPGIVIVYLEETVEFPMYLVLIVE